MIRYFCKYDEKLVHINEPIYTITGKNGNCHGTNRYIQCNAASWARPHIETYCGYNAFNVVVFKSKIAAENFLGKFLESKSRKSSSRCIEWEIKEFKRHGYKSRNIDYELVPLFDYEYGWFYRLKLIGRNDIENKMEEEKKNMFEMNDVNLKFDELDNLLIDLKNTVLELREAVNEDKKVALSFSEEDLCELSNEDMDVIISYIKNNYDPTDVYGDEDLVDCVKNFTSIDEMFDHDDIMNYVYDNYCPEDLVRVDIDWQ